jgi:hypothetical protein
MTGVENKDKQRRLLETSLPFSCCFRRDPVAYRAAAGPLRMRPSAHCPGSEAGPAQQPGTGNQLPCSTVVFLISCLSTKIFLHFTFIDSCLFYAKRPNIEVKIEKIF